MNNPPLAPLLVVLLLVGAEALWSWRTGRGVYEPKEVLNNFATMFIGGLLRPLSVAWTFAVLSLLEPLQLFKVTENVWGFLLAFVAVDFFFYWYHRATHAIPLLWTMHHTHHSSPWMNLTTAVRLNWLGKFVGPLFYTPLMLVGFSPLLIAGAMALGLFVQLPLHTQAIGRLGWFEGKLFNTPSAHRVHHGSNPQYIDKNFGGVFIVWDRLFGTYEPEFEPVRYGVTTGFLGHNPLAAQFYPLWKYLRGEWQREKDRLEDAELMTAVTGTSAGASSLHRSQQASASPEPAREETAMATAGRAPAY